MHRNAVNRAVNAVRRRLRSPEAVDLVHSVPYDAPGRKQARARCGISVDRGAQTGPVTCPTCLEEITHNEGLNIVDDDYVLTDKPPADLFGALPDDEPERPALAAAPASVDEFDRLAGELAPVTAAQIESLLERADEPPTPGAGHLLTFPGPAVEAALVSIAFPSLAPGVTRIDFAALEAPAKRLAELIEAIEPVLAPPEAVAKLEALVLRANALQVTDRASFDRANEIYEELCANEKGIVDSIGPVVAFFHRPWSAMTAFRARFAKPVDAAKKRMSSDAGTWKANDDARVEREALAAAAAAELEEKQHLQVIADQARQTGDTELAAAAEEAVTQTAAPIMPRELFAPATTSAGTGTRKEWRCEVVDVAAVYRAIADGKIPRTAAPLDESWLDKQASSLQRQMEELYPGTKAVQKTKLRASGRR